MAYLNPEDKKKYCKAYYEKHKQAMKDAANKYYAEHKEKTLQIVAKYRIKNRDKIRSYLKERWHTVGKSDSEARKKFYSLCRRRYYEDEEYRNKLIVRASTWNKYGHLLKIEKCSKCDSRGELVFHHITYEVDNFIILCNICHKNLHYVANPMNNTMKHIVEA